MALTVFLTVSNSSLHGYVHFIQNDMSYASTRERGHLFIPRANTCIRSRSLCIAGPKLWNKLPTHIKNVKSVFSFKKKLKMDLRRRQVCNIF